MEQAVWAVLNKQHVMLKLVKAAQEVQAEQGVLAEKEEMEWMELVLMFM